LQRCVRNSETVQAHATGATNIKPVDLIRKRRAGTVWCGVAESRTLTKTLSFPICFTTSPMLLAGSWSLNNSSRRRRTAHQVAKSRSRASGVSSNASASQIGQASPPFCAPFPRIRGGYAASRGDSCHSTPRCRFSSARDARKGRNDRPFVHGTGIEKLCAEPTPATAGFFLRNQGRCCGFAYLGC
jgi:hypothetical protein